MSARLTCSLVSCSSSSSLRFENPTLRRADLCEWLLSLKSPAPLFSNATDISKRFWSLYNTLEGCFIISYVNGLDSFLWLNSNSQKLKLVSQNTFTFNLLHRRHLFGFFGQHLLLFMISFRNDFPFFMNSDRFLTIFDVEPFQLNSNLRNGQLQKNFSPERK